MLSASRDGTRLAAVSIAYRLDPQLGCTFIVWDSDVTPERWSAHVERILTDPGFPPAPLVLGDLRTAGGAPAVSTDAIKEMAQRWSSHAPALGHMQWAILPNGGWEKARRFERELDAPTIRTMVFNEPWSACRWLGLDPDTATSILEELRAQLRV